MACVHGRFGVQRPHTHCMGGVAPQLQRVCAACAACACMRALVVSAGTQSQASLAARAQSRQKTSGQKASIFLSNLSPTIRGTPMRCPCMRDLSCVCPSSPGARHLREERAAFPSQGYHQLHTCEYDHTHTHTHTTLSDHAHEHPNTHPRHTRPRPVSALQLVFTAQARCCNPRDAQPPDYDARRQ